MTSNSQKQPRGHARDFLFHGLLLLVFGVASIGAGVLHALADMPNACPVDGCEVKIEQVARSGEELELTFKSNFTPDVSKNHFHVWWGENFTVEQMGRWHRHDDYPTYITQGAASTKVRGKATTICVSAADRHHNILDVKKYHCVDASQHL